jgi:hypothetical protein
MPLKGLYKNQTLESHWTPPVPAELQGSQEADKQANLAEQKFQRY